MPRIWIILFLFICTICSDRAVAQSRCNTDQIRSQLETSERFPDLTGCRPDNVRLLLQNYDYGLTIENRVTSRTIREGRIVSQRLQSSNVYVDVSTGPGPQRDRDAIVDVLEGVGRIIATLPPPSQRPPASEPSPQQPPPAPDQRLIDVMAIPPPAPTEEPAPPVRPPNVEPTPPPPVIPTPAVTPVAQAPPAPAPNTERNVAQVPEPRPEPAPIPPVAETAPSPTIDGGTVQAGADFTSPTGQPPQEPAVVTPPAVSRFVIQGSASAKEGDELLLVIRREGRDGLGHRLELSYSDPSLLVSPPSTFEFGAGMPDEVTLRLRTAVAEDDGDHQLIVRLASADAEVRQPDSLTAAILDRTPWWERLLEGLASIPVWAVALAGATAAVGLGLYLIPRATCSIDGGSIGFGARRPMSRWPSVHVDTVLGDPSFSIPSPLPIGRRRNAEPSPI